jgi:hypothetical protein
MSNPLEKKVISQKSVAVLPIPLEKQLRVIRKELEKLKPSTLNFRIRKLGLTDLLGKIRSGKPRGLSTG